MRSISILTVFLVKVNIPRTRTRFLFPLWPKVLIIDTFSSIKFPLLQLMEQEKWNVRSNCPTIIGVGEMEWKRNCLCLLPCWSNHLILNCRNKRRNISSHATSPAPIIGAGEMEWEEQLSNNYWNRRNGMGGETVCVFSRVGQTISPLIVVIRYEHLKRSYTSPYNFSENWLIKHLITN